MFITGHQMTAGLPWADGVDKRPGDIYDHSPYHVVQRCRPFGTFTNNTRPGCNPLLAFQLCHVCDRRTDAAETIDDIDNKKDRCRHEYQKHQRVGDDHTFGSGIHRKQRVAEPGDNQTGDE